MSFAKNKKAYHDYEIIEEFEAGVKLLGPEMKSVRAGKIQLKGGYISVLSDGAPYLSGVHISPYKFAHKQDLDPVRKRKLLLNQKEIAKLVRAEKQAGMSVIPLEFYPKRGLIKVKIAIGKGKKLHDKRRTVKEKDLNRQIDRALKRFK